MAESFYIREMCGNYRFDRSVKESEILELASDILHSRCIDSDCFQSSHIASKFLRCKLGKYKREVFECMFLNTRHYLIKSETLFFGTIDGSSVHPREIARRALELHAKAIIIAHNHPSGRTIPSDCDVVLTNKIGDALKLFHINLLDHIIVSHDDYFSFSDNGYTL